MRPRRPPMPACATRDVERVLSELVIQFVDMEVAAHPWIVTECERRRPSSSEAGAILYEGARHTYVNRIGHVSAGGLGCGPRARPSASRRGRLLRASLKEAWRF
jgi:hypothetical protein